MVTTYRGIPEQDLTLEILLIPTEDKKIKRLILQPNIHIKAKETYIYSFRSDSDRLTFIARDSHGVRYTFTLLKME